MSTHGNRNELFFNMQSYCQSSIECYKTTFGELFYNETEAGDFLEMLVPFIETKVFEKKKLKFPMKISYVH